MLFLSCKSRQAKVKEAQQHSSKSKIAIIDPEALSILDSTATIEVVAKGFNWTEGPLYISDGDYFIFSDIPANKIYKWKDGQKVTPYLMPSGNSETTVVETKEPGSNGLLLHPDGQLVLCQHGDRRMAKMIAPLNNPRPEFVTLADNYKGKRLNSPNDAVYHSNGDLYFTDPPYGMDKGIDDPKRELDFQGVYRLKPTGELDLLTKELRYPNGIALSPDGKFLYVASSDGANYIWMQYELDANGLAKNQHLFYEAHSYEGKKLGAPDGMKINKRGYLFATGPEGVWLFNPAGKLIARLYTGQLTSNCALSLDERVLFMTCDDYIMQVKLKK
ncbi:MAG: SMP-30/gluconolactonase/LRE family protein [Ferruginibacter sp.]|nr:SMP-30/gluconolactonase/LRE family protein [Ferruginibacter sp.]